MEEVCTTPTLVSQISSYLKVSNGTSFIPWLKGYLREKEVGLPTQAATQACQLCTWSIHVLPLVRPRKRG